MKWHGGAFRESWEDMQNRIHLRRQIVFFLICLLVFTGCTKPEDKELFLAPEEGGARENTTDPEAAEGEIPEASLAGEAPEEEEKEEAPRWYVQVSGAVHEPGVYEVFPGARIFDAVRLAGGLTEDAAEDSINQAGFLSDGEFIRILTHKEASELSEEERTELLSGRASEEKRQGSGPGEAGGVVDINTASLSELMSLPGIGESKAKRILEYREQNGAFSTGKDITKVSGIGASTYESLKDRITAG